MSYEMSQNREQGLADVSIMLPADTIVEAKAHIQFSNSWK